MLWRALFLLIFITGSVIPIGAHALDVSLLAAGVATKREIQTVTSDITSDSYGTLGGGLLLDFSPKKRIGVESGLIYLRRKIGFGPNTTQAYSAIEVPIGLRLRLGPLSLGAGGFVLYGVGGVKNEVSSNTEDRSFNNANLSRLDFGPYASVDLKFKLSSKLRGRVDIRYQLGQKDILKADNLKGNHQDFILMAGVVF